MAPPPRLQLVWLEPGKGRRVTFGLSAGARIGSSPELAEIVLPVAGINPLHAELQSIGDELEIVAIGPSIVSVDGQTVSRARIRAGSRVTLGNLDLVVASTAPPPTLPAPVPARAPPRAAPHRAGSTRPPLQHLALTAASSSLITGLAVYFVMSTRAVPRAAVAAPPKAPAIEPSPAIPRVDPTAVPQAPSTDSGTSDRFVAVKKALVTVLGKLSFEPGFATGSGFFVTRTGEVITNYHVVHHTDYQQVLMAGRSKPVNARIIAKDLDHDLALLQVYIDPPAPVAPLGVSVPLKMGDTVFALGSPSGPTLAATLTRGVVGADEARKFGDVLLLQHDAAINPGNSGGPLIDQNGNVVGVNSLKIRDTEGLSFAVPVEDVRVFLDAHH